MIRTILVMVALVLITADPASGQALETPETNGPRQWTTRWKFADVDVAKVIANLSWIGFEIPFEVSGNASVDLTVGVPFDRLRDAEAYTISGSIASTRLIVDQLQLKDFSCNAKIERGTLHIDDLQASVLTKELGDELEGHPFASDTVPDSRSNGSWPTENHASLGTLTGSAKIDLIARSDEASSSQLVLSLNAIPIEPIFAILQAFDFASTTRKPTGLLSGDLSIETPTRHLTEMAFWEGDASVSIENLRVGDAEAVDISADKVQFHAACIYVGRALIGVSHSGKTILEGIGQAKLTNEIPFEMRLRCNDLPLSDLSEILFAAGDPNFPLAEGNLDLRLNASGHLGDNSKDESTRSLRVTGEIASPSLHIGGLHFGLLEHSLSFVDDRLKLDPVARDAKDERVKIHSLSALVECEQGLGIRDLKARMMGGEFFGSLTLPSHSGGFTELKLNWQGIRADLSHSIFQIQNLPSELPLSIETSGKLDWKVPISGWDVRSMHSGNAKVKLASVSIDERELLKGELKVAANTEAIKLDMLGETLGGSFKIQTQTNSTQATREDDPKLNQSWWQQTLSESTGVAEFEAVDLLSLSKIAEILGLTPSDQRLRGKLSGKLDLSDKKASLTMRGLSLRGDLLSQRITANASLVGDQVSIDSVEGSYAGGTVRMVGRWALREGARSLQVSLSRVDLGRAALLVNESMTDLIDGKVSGRVTVTDAGAYRARGSMTVHESRISKLKTGDIHSTFSASAASDLSRWNLTLPGISGSVAGGRVEGRVEIKALGGRAGYDLNSSFRLRRSDFGALLSSAGIGSRFAHGYLTGSIDVQGQRIKGIGDLKGFFKADLSQTEGDAIPGVVGMDRFVSAVPLTQTQFGSGYIRGSVRRGVANIEEFWLRNQSVRMFAEGDISMASSRMNLDTVLATGDMKFEAEPLAALATQIAIQAVIPIAAVAEINRLLSDRTIYFNIRGTASNPIVRLKPFETIRENAARFFYREIANAAATSIGVDVWN